MPYQHLNRKGRTMTITIANRSLTISDRFIGLVFLALLWVLGAAAGLGISWLAGADHYLCSAFAGVATIFTIACIAINGSLLYKD
jgi:hypothetical protein